MNTSVLHGGRRWLAVLACLAGLIAAPAYAQTCGSANQRGAKIQGDAVLDNVFDFNEVSAGVFDPNKLTIKANPSSRPTVGPGVTYSWSQGAGQTPGSFSTPTGTETVFTVPDVAPLGEAITVTLTIHSVAPSCPGTWTDTITLNVVDKDDVVVNAKPVASAVATPSLVDEGVPVTLDGTASYDPEGLPLGYQWTQVSGTPVALSGADTDTASFEAPNTAYPAGDTLEFSLRVSDGVYEDVKNVTVNVTWVNDPPVTLLSCPLAVDERSAVELDGSESSDSDDGIASYAWTGGWPDVDLSAFDTQAITVTAPTLGYQDPGFYTFRLTATDAFGAYTFDDCTVQVRDVTPPRLDLPQDIDQEAESAAGNTVFYAASAFDAVDGTVPDDHFSCAPPSGSTFPLGTAPAKSHTTTVNCQATDSAGNTASASFNVTIRDTTPPVITAPLSLSAEATGPDGAAVEFSATTYDVVDGSGTATCTHASGSVFPLGDTSVTCNAIDQRGNAASPATFVVRVVDTTPPVISYLGDVEATATGDSSAVVNYTPTAWDIVDGDVPVNCKPASGSTFPIGATTVNCSAIDNAGNEATGSFQVTVTYAWNGFFRPVDMAPTVNSAKAGSAIPLKFSLGGYQGMGIMETGYPKSAPMGCSSNEDPLTETFTAGQSSLQYDASANQYIYVWKSEKSWAGTCRQIQVKLIDRTTHTANFSFK